MSDLVKSNALASQSYNLMPPLDGKIRIAGRDGEIQDFFLNISDISRKLPIILAMNLSHPAQGLQELLQISFQKPNALDPSFLKQEPDGTAANG